MAYTAQRFQPLELAQISPASYALQQGLKGIGAGVDLRSKIIEQQLARLEKKQKEAELPYAGLMAQATAQYKSALANYLSSPNQALKYLSGVGKTYIEPGVVGSILNSNGVNNGSIQPNAQPENETPAYDEQGNEISDSYNLQRQKMTTDVQARNRDLFASNIEKTLGFIKPKDLTAYSGIKGQLQQKVDAVKSGLGNKVEKYQKYLESKQAAGMLAKQVRQFYGDSIRPEMEMSLGKLTNPSYWDRDPEGASKLFEQLTNILNVEMGTYRGALKSTKVYQGKQGNNNFSAGSKSLSHGLELPTFNSREEALKWFNSQPKTVQNAVRLRLSGGT